MGRRKELISGVKIIDIGDKGMSVGKSPDGQIIMIEKDAVPGDEVDVLVLRKKKGVKHALVQSFIKHSEHRVQAFCQHFGVCGGCKWQHLDYNIQAELKEKAVREAIRRIAKEDPNKVQDIRKASRIKEYRNKLEYTFSTKRWLTNEEVKSGESFGNRNSLGFHIAGAFDKVLEIEKCHLQENLSNELRNYLRQLSIEKGWKFYDIRENHGMLRNLIVRNSSLGEWMVSLVFGAEDDQLINEIFTALKINFPKVSSWNYMINPKQNSSLFDIETIHVAGEEFITEQLGDVKYEISPKSFFQTNSYQAKTLYDTALELAAIKQTDIVYDLYTGTGSIALYLAAKCKQVIGIEEVPEAILDAKKNAKLNDIKNARFFTGDVKEILSKQFWEEYGSPDIVITDPPRAGMHPDVVSILLELGANKLVYISCNPSTQARDIHLLSSRYELAKIIPVDMFPHTSHIESVALLQLII